MNLDQIREEIDRIDDEMLQLFERRMSLCHHVAEYKLVHKMDILVPEREAQIRKEVLRKAQPDLADYDGAFFDSILSLSRAYQATILKSLQEVPDTLRAGRLLLVPLQLDDLLPVYSLTSDPKVAQYMHFAVHDSPYQTKALIQELTAAPNRAYLVLLDGSSFVGVFAFKPGKENPKEVDLSIFLAPQYWGLGYCSELLHMARDTAGALFHATALKAWVISANLGSCRALEKAGFSVESRLTFPDIKGELRVYRLELPR